MARELVSLGKNDSVKLNDVDQHTETLVDHTLGGLNIETPVSETAPKPHSETLLKAWAYQLRPSGLPRRRL